MIRVAIIGAAAAYTIASADDDMAIKIAGETTSNGTRRLGHQFIVGLESLNNATTENLSESYKSALIYVEAAIDNEKETLESILELAEDKKAVSNYIIKMQKTIDAIGKSHLAALNTHMDVVAKKLGLKPVKVLWTELEKRSSKIIPKPTAKIKMNGYGGYRTFITKVPKEERDKYPYTRREIASTSELHSLINGKRSVLDIKKMLDAQYQRKSKLQSIINYLEILKLAGLIEMK